MKNNLFKLLCYWQNVFIKLKYIIMNKVYKSNLQYNSTKKRNGIILCILLFLGIGGLMSVFIAKQSVDFAIMTGAFILFPIILFPSIFMMYPTDGRAILTITDKDVTVGKETYKLKDVTKFRVIIELPYSRIESENQALLEEMKTAKLEDVWYGNLDIIVKDEKGKSKMLYTHIDNVVDGMLTLIKLGIKNYELSFSLRKNKVVSEYDFRKDVLDEIDEKQATVSKKENKKHLI